MNLPIPSLLVCVQFVNLLVKNGYRVNCGYFAPRMLLSVCFGSLDLRKDKRVRQDSSCACARIPRARVPKCTK